MGSGDQLARRWRTVPVRISSKHERTVGELVRDEHCRLKTVYGPFADKQGARFPLTARAVHLKIFDHLIVSSGGVFSFGEANLL